MQSIIRSAILSVARPFRSGQILAAEAPVVIHVVLSAFDGGDKLGRVAEYAVWELVKELDVQTVMV